MKNMSASEPITLSRACEVIEIPSGTRGTLPAGAVVRIMQSLAGSYTVATDRGDMYRVEAKDTDALGLSNAAMAQEPSIRHGIPVSISDAAKLQLGFDLDYGITHASPPIYGERK